MGAERRGLRDFGGESVVRLLMKKRHKLKTLRKGCMGHLEQQSVHNEANHCVQRVYTTSTAIKLFTFQDKMYFSFYWFS